MDHCLYNIKGTGCLAPPPAAPSADATIQFSVGLNGVNRRADVETVQTLLNIASARTGVPKKLLKVDGWIGPLTVAAIHEFQKANFGSSDGRVDPNQKTIRRLNEIAKSSPAPTPAPPTPPVLTPRERAFEVLPLATMWVTLASVHLNILLASFKMTKTADPGQHAMVNTHFHLDREPAKLEANLQELIRLYGLMVRTYADAQTIFLDGPATPDSPFADAPMGGFQLPGTQFHRITFRPGFVNCGPNTRAAMLVHEGAHFVGGINEISHFAMEFPAPDGQAQGKGNVRNYSQLLTKEAMRNASSFAAFAIHAATGTDHRYGAADITQ